MTTERERRPGGNGAATEPSAAASGSSADSATPRRQPGFTRPAAPRDPGEVRLPAPPTLSPHGRKFLDKLREHDRARLAAGRCTCVTRCRSCSPPPRSRRREPPPAPRTPDPVDPVARLDDVDRRVDNLVAAVDALHADLATLSIRVYDLDEAVSA